MNHSLRPLFSLNGFWDFAFLGTANADSFAPENTPSMEKMLVPSAFDALPAYAGKRGLAFYRTRFSTPPGRKARLHFGAVSMWTRIYVDGTPLLEHACGYAPFTVEVPPSERPSRELLVLVDNQFDFDRVPMHLPHFDFYQYGGILRDVTLHILPEAGCWIDNVQVTPTADYAAGHCEVRLFSGGTIPAGTGYRVYLDGAVEPVVSMPLAERDVRFEIRVPAPRVWSPETPNLHKLRLEFVDPKGNAFDDAEVRFGLRRIESREGQLWLNGKPFKLRGYNRHEWHPNSGPCTPAIQMFADLQLLKDLGSNFVRGCHYPQDQHFLDLCDELGFLVWEENLGWGQGGEMLLKPKFRTDHLATLRDMVRTSWNHPSIIIWGFLNEAWTNRQDAAPVVEETVAALRSMDPLRLISFASNHPFDDLQFGAVDIISLNVYPGWYDAEDAQEPLKLIRPYLEKCFDHIDAQGWGEKPVIISEIGAEALYGWRDPLNDFFTEEYQAQYLKEACHTALTHPRCSGIVLWHFSDVRTYGGGRAIGRPRTFNNKGTLDEYRRPKAAYQTVRDIFRRHKNSEASPLGDAATD